MNAFHASNILIFAVVMCFSLSVQSENINPVNCQFDTAEKTVTPITFFLLSKPDETKALRDRIQDWVTEANYILANSCIPVERRVDNIIEINDSFEPLFSYSAMEVSERMLRYYFADKFATIDSNPFHYYGIVYSESASTALDNYCGSTYETKLPNYFQILSRCHKFGLEYTLGRLAWAQGSRDALANRIVSSINTDKTWLSELVKNNSSQQIVAAYQNYLKNKLPVWEQKYLKDYGFGYHCGGYGTLMAPISELETKVLPLYSTPLAQFKGEACGDSSYADNRRLMIEFYKSR
ncbi:hypothetical protein [Vibrio sonorensis]|uniref:hypothetical protein n=1 Tax=Vibrio sonorensis TaxID=1004316 RepID=UPI0008DAE97C|nr:hypothetical protein [Vibrio sonorensis]